MMEIMVSSIGGERKDWEDGYRHLITTVYLMSLYDPVKAPSHESNDMHTITTNKESTKERKNVSNQKLKPMCVYTVKMHNISSKVMLLMNAFVKPR